MEYANYLMHFNPNHDPRNGQFAKGHGLVRANANASVKLGRKIVAAGKKVKQNLQSDRGRKVLGAAAVVGGISAVGHAVLLGKLSNTFKTLTDGEYGVPVTDIALNTAKVAGRSAAKTALIAYGAIKISDLFKSKKSDTRPAESSRALTVADSDSATTKRVKSDYNSMTDNEFRRKYSTSKGTYAKRVERYGDPYMNSPMAKLGKKLKKRK
jgi:hypothetical protein